MSDTSEANCDHSSDDDCIVVSKKKTTKKSATKSTYRRMDFNLDDEERLIELVKSNEFLFNVSHSSYKDRLKRIKTWDDIAQTLSKSSDDCKKKWKNIKDAYNRTKEKPITGSGSSNQVKRMEALSFLDTCASVNTKYVFFI